ncbi:MAG: methyltransferase domain-containing protein [Gammaproteobacteria bacterium]|nr:methyltransferase domain-containing protein [Gammaproteobacteria bacterium]MDH4313997.1 methyltransferase domain-containing protein [Gammaproteobacteria bacterium]MDH5212731.1 methyltransferase domain-containing protein [Gammaproteobacteria bacterium]MDH5500129.1 methyltransferase domain-containing protein [Gammaproteobacteria bacterium]
MKQQNHFESTLRDRKATRFGPARIAVRNTLVDGWSLGAALLRSPREVGAILPSGRFLADAMAREIAHGDGLVVELGGGTGSITAGLLRAGIASNKLVIIERDPQLCGRLRRRFPACTIVRGDARELQALLQHSGIADPVKAVVSALPILTMNRDDQDSFLREALRTGSGGPLIQFTYGLRCPVPAELLARHGAAAKRRTWIWQNLPPASVWRIEQTQVA